MAHVRDRHSDGYDGPLRWRARWRDADGQEHSKSFRTRAEADAHNRRMLDHRDRGITLDIARSRRMRLDEYIPLWMQGQAWRPSTRAQVQSHVRNHIVPQLGRMKLSGVQPRDIQRWVNDRAEHLAPTTVEVVYRYLVAIFRSAVRERILVESPCVDIKLPEKPIKRVEPPTAEHVMAIAGLVPPRYRAMILLAAGTGLRQGECLGLRRRRVDFDELRVRVDEQLVLVSGRPEFGPPKSKASHRTVPLPETVAAQLETHMREFPSNEDGLVFTSERGDRIRRNRFSDAVWRPAREAAALGRPLFFHDLRHFYASVLIQAGESVKVVQERLGHTSAQETLDTYSHLWHRDEESTRAAVNAALRI